MRILVLPGDGIGPEITQATLAVLDRANPTSLFLSAAMLLDWMAPHHRNNALAGAAQRIEQAVDAALAKPGTRTPDLGGRLGTQAFAAEVVSRI